MASLLLFLFVLFFVPSTSNYITNEIQNCATNTNSSDTCTIVLQNEYYNITQNITMNESHPSITITSSSGSATITFIDSSIVLTEYTQKLKFDKLIIESSNSWNLSNSSNSWNLSNSSNSSNSSNTDQTYQSWLDIDISENTSISLEITNSIIQNTGHIYISKSVLEYYETTNNKISLTNTTFTNNTGVLSLSGHEFEVNISNCTFKSNQNHPDFKNGGCIHWQRSSSNHSTTNDTTTADGNDYISIKQSIFESNYAQQSGGVIYIIQDTEADSSNHSNNRSFELIISDCIFQENTASIYGGVIRHSGYTYTTSEFEGTSISCDDSLYSIDIRDSTFDGNTVDGSNTYEFGGSIAVTCVQLFVSNCDFNDNYAKYGGSLSVYASSSLQMESCSFKNNIAEFGGAIYVNGLIKTDNATNYSVNIDGCDFINNTATDYGAAIDALVLTDLRINGSRFIGNENANLGSITLEYFQSYQSMSAYIYSSIFDNNVVDPSTDNYIGGAAITAVRYDYGSEIDFELNCLSDLNSYYNSSKSLNLFVFGSEFTGNDRSAVGLYGVSALIDTCDFTGNNNDESSGGAIESKFSWFSVSNSNFIGNNASSMTGGAISTTDTVFDSSYDWELPCDIVISGSVFEENYAEMGGAVFIGSNVTVKNNVFTDNTGHYGGALSMCASIMTLEGNIFEGNTAVIHGGAVFETEWSNQENTDNAILSMKHNEFKNNSAGTNGGCVLLRTTKSQSVIFEGNAFIECSDTAFVIVQLYELGNSNDSLNALSNITDSNLFDDDESVCCASYPSYLYIKSIDDYTISPSISSTIAYGGIDLFGNDFYSFTVQDWQSEAVTFSFQFLPSTESDVAFELQTINDGSITGGQSNLTWSIDKGMENDTVNFSLTSNMASYGALNAVTKTWDVIGCPSGYGYNSENQTCNACERRTFQVNTAWEECKTCLNGLSCRGADHIHILSMNWWSEVPEFSVDSVKDTFFCRLGDCCTSESGCDPSDDSRCKSDRNPDSIGCGQCAEGLSAVHGSNKCRDCGWLGDGYINAWVALALCLYAPFLCFLFGLTYIAESKDVNTGKSHVSFTKFYFVSLIQIAWILLIDYYQSLPAILTFSPDKGTRFFINVFSAKLPVSNDGVCFFDGQTKLDQTLWDLLLPSMIMTISAVVYIVRLIGVQCGGDSKTFGRIVFTKWRCMFDPLRCGLLSLFFCAIPMLQTCASLFLCIDYGNSSVFWNAPGQSCDESVIAGCALLFVYILCLWIVANVYYSHFRILKKSSKIKKRHGDIPMHCQRLQPFYFMIYPYREEENKKSTKQPKIGEEQRKRKWKVLKGFKEWTYLYTFWFAPFIRKLMCVFVYTLTTGNKGQSDQTFAVAMINLIMLVVYQMYSLEYTKKENLTRALYTIYLFYWMVLLIVCGSTQIISKYESNGLFVFVSVIMWLPFVACILVCLFGVVALVKPESMDHAPGFFEDWTAIQTIATIRIRNTPPPKSVTSSVQLSHVSG